MRKWARGRRIADPAEALRLIVEGRVLFWGEKPQNAAWLGAMQINTIAMAARRGILYRAREAQKP